MVNDFSIEFICQERKNILIKEHLLVQYDLERYYPITFMRKHFPQIVIRLNPSILNYQLFIIETITRFYTTRAVPPFVIVPE